MISALLGEFHASETFTMQSISENAVLSENILTFIW